MKQKETLLLSLVSSLALATAQKCSAPPPQVSSLGSLQVLKYNDLRTENNGTAAVLAYGPAKRSEAQARCAAIGESLYQIPEHPDPNDAGLAQLHHQLDYLIFARDLPSDGSLWVQHPSSAPRDQDQGQGQNEKRDGGALAYAYGPKTLSDGDKKTDNDGEEVQLPVLCSSSSVTPTTYETRNKVVNSSQITVSADDYKVTGYRDGRAFRFQGIPFADPPVDKLRFAPPQPYSGKKDVKATKFSASCMQQTNPNSSTVEVSEDCLYLNVYTPVLPASNTKTKRSSGGDVRRRPVAIYMYGGAFMGGTGSTLQSDGGNFASRNDVVVVTFNYRLGALGFLMTGSKNKTPGNSAIRDQILAIKWVKDHISSFGGDPEHITIFGQSAGAQSVVALLSSTAAKGLFGGAVAKSSPVSLPWFTREVYTEFITPQVASDVGCKDKIKDEEELLSCLRAADAKKFVYDVDNATISNAVNDGYLHTSALVAGIEPFLPVVDDSDSGVIDDQFHKLLAADKLPNPVPTIFSVMSDEAAAWIDSVPELGSSQAALDLALPMAYPADLAAAMTFSGHFKVDSSNPDGVRVALTQFITRSEWICPTSYLLGSAANSSNSSTPSPPLYEMMATRGHSGSTGSPEICVPNDVYNATCHAADVSSTWGTVNADDPNIGSYYDHDDLLFSQIMNDVFGAFFRTYNPNPDVHMLGTRGPAYATTNGIFAGSDHGGAGYKFHAFKSREDDVNTLDVPPGYTDGPVTPEQCKVFEDYGYTFERAKMKKS